MLDQTYPFQRTIRALHNVSLPFLAITRMTRLSELAMGCLICPRIDFLQAREDGRGEVSCWFAFQISRGRSGLEFADVGNDLGVLVETIVR